MAFTEQQKVDIRRFCGAPVFGNNFSASPPSFGYRYYKWYLTLEYRLINLAPEEEATIISVYLANLTTLESAIPTASENLDTDRAAVWYHNKNEVRDRYNLFKLWCRRLQEFLGFDAPLEGTRSFSLVV